MTPSAAALEVLEFLLNATAIVGTSRRAPAATRLAANQYATLLESQRVELQSAAPVSYAIPYTFDHLAPGAEREVLELLLKSVKMFEKASEPLRSAASCYDTMFTGRLEKLPS